MEEAQRKIENSIKSASILIENELYKNAATELWIAVRSAIFYYLNKENIPFSSTKYALKEIILKYSSCELSSQIIFTETIGVLSEWDEYFEISKLQIVDFEIICVGIVNHFIEMDSHYKKKYLRCVNNQTDYSSFLDEINRHIQDAESAAATNYSAAIRLNKNYNKFLRWGFVVTLIGLTCLVKDFLCCSYYNVYSQLTVLLGALLTLWPLIKDYSGKSVNHRRFAEEYNNIIKHCKNWQTNYPDGCDLLSARYSVICLRERIIVINNLSPATISKDYRSGSRNIDKGSYKYLKTTDKKNDYMGKKLSLIKGWGENTAYSAKGHFKSADLRKSTITILLVVNLIFALFTLMDLEISSNIIKVMGGISLIATICLLIFESQNGKNSIKEHMQIGEEYLSVHYDLQKLFSKDVITDDEINVINERLNEIRKKDQPMISQIAKKCAAKAIEKKGEMIMWWTE